MKVDILCLVWPTRKHCFGESGIQLINLAGTWKNTWVNSECALKLLSRQFSLKWNSFAFELCLVAPHTTLHCTTYSVTRLQFCDTRLASRNRFFCNLRQLCTTDQCFSRKQGNYVSQSVVRIWWATTHAQVILNPYTAEVRDIARGQSWEPPPTHRSYWGSDPFEPDIEDLISL